ncbi:hypothetical protein Mcate_02817 [Meiothermus taiwanensis]|uniref:Uncharacterized protein n=1 Tax=Meiothermus taiwanensis TaxID=172827 RepID=A0A399DSW2_9DEIN|nr:hypothetical protein Mcate_02817 [Meiothermus taiwanensis]GIW32253.1 MAG: hypothetical protein KatS3mg071_2427 [Meiothermus sp.]
MRGEKQFLDPQMLSNDIGLEKEFFLLNVKFTFKNLFYVTK